MIFKALADGRTNEGTLRGPRGPKNVNILQAIRTSWQRLLHTYSYAPPPQYICTLTRARRIIVSCWVADFSQSSSTCSWPSQWCHIIKNDHSGFNDNGIKNIFIITIINIITTMKTMLEVFALLYSSPWLFLTEIKHSCVSGYGQVGHCYHLYHHPTTRI